MGLATIGGAVGGGGAPPVADTTLKRLALTPDSLTGSASDSALSTSSNGAWFYAVLSSLPKL